MQDLVISVPAGGGYGGPTIYFANQGAGLLAERCSFGQRLGLARGWRGWLFAMTVLAAPLRLLFHLPFVKGVVVDRSGGNRAIGAAVCGGASPCAPALAHGVAAVAALSILNARELASGSGLARGVCAYVAVFWGVRLACQGVFDMKPYLTRPWMKAGYAALTVLFASLTLIYGWAAIRGDDML